MLNISEKEKYFFIFCRAFLLVEKETVRPGILVLINDTDWELLSQLSTELKDGDTITFISTLHGG